MARVGILTCSNATQDLGCSSVVCLADLRKRKGFFEISTGHYRSIPPFFSPCHSPRLESLGPLGTFQDRGILSAPVKATTISRRK